MLVFFIDVCLYCFFISFYLAIFPPPPFFLCNFPLTNSLLPSEQSVRGLLCDQNKPFLLSCSLFFVCLDAVYVIQSGGEAECQKQHTYKQTNKQHKQTQEDDDEMDGRMICSSWNDRLTQDNRADTKSQVGKRKRRWRKGWTERWQGFDGEDVILAGRCLKQLFAPVCVCVWVCSFSLFIVWFVFLSMEWCFRRGNKDERERRGGGKRGFRKSYL